MDIEYREGQMRPFYGAVFVRGGKAILSLCFGAVSRTIRRAPATAGRQKQIKRRRPLLPRLAS